MKLLRLVHSIRSSPGVALLLCSIFALCFALAVRATPPAHTASDGGSAAGELAWDTAEQDLWAARIQELGASKAYEAFAASIAGLNPSDQHLLAHQFGGILHAEEGSKGIVACDGRFSWGCVHEVIARSIGEQGFGVIAEFGEHCRTLDPIGANSCFHSIGHGIVGWYGYSKEHLKKSLASCDAYFPDSSANPFGGCYSGVFMEFNLRTLTGEGAAAYRPASDGDYHELCYSLPEQYQRTCAFDSYQWWLTLSIDRSIEAVSRIGKECRAYRTAAMVDACYRGVGDHWPITAVRSAADIRERCEVLAPDMHGQLWCKAYAAAISTQLNGSGGEAVCERLVGAPQAFCMQYATGAANRMREAPLPKEYQ